MKTLSDYIRKPYHYVPPCPRCGNPVTGRYLKLKIGGLWVVMEALKRGELVQPTNVDSQRKHAFCNECGYEWYENVRLRWLPNGETIQQMAIRHTEDYLELMKLLNRYRWLKRWADFVDRFF